MLQKFVLVKSEATEKNCHLGKIVKFAMQFLEKIERNERQVEELL